MQISDSSDNGGSYSFLNSKVSQELKYLSTNGVTLNPDEKMNISLALQQLQCELHFEEMMLWGKINGR